MILSSGALSGIYTEREIKKSRGDNNESIENWF